MNTQTVDTAVEQALAFENKVMRKTATTHLDNINDLRRAAVEAYTNTIGKIGEAEAFDLAMNLSKQYEIAMQAYAALGLTDLGIHNVKAGA